ncbi:aconitase family protein, partial [Escherichia coli]|uniref:aconitase family protein n=1 Tax=Escherichia coli TaxID=562 RepID=UPI00210AEFA6
ATHKDRLPVEYVMNGHQYQLPDGAVVNAAITSCTNTSNPSVLMAAGLLAKKAVTLGLKRQPWVKASLAPGSKVVSDYLAKAKLTPYPTRLNPSSSRYGVSF